MPPPMAKTRTVKIRASNKGESIIKRIISFAEFVESQLENPPPIVKEIKKIPEKTENNPIKCQMFINQSA